MDCNMKPPVAKSRLLPELRARVLELRRTHSAADVARQTGLPVGTVKAVCSRAGTTRDNSAARAFFALPPLALANTTAVTAPAALPVQRNSTHQNATTPARPLSRVFALWRHPRTALVAI